MDTRCLRVPFAALLAVACGGGSAKDTAAPEAPKYVQATPQGATAIRLEWLASKDNVAVTGYRIQRDGDLFVTVNAMEFVDSGLPHAAHHCYVVSAIDAAGNESAPAAEACATTDRFSTDSIDAAGGFACSIAVDAAGHAHAAYFDGTKVRHATNASGSWTSEPLAAVGAPTSRFHTAIAVDGAGKLHVAFEDGGIHYLTNKSGAWSDDVVADGAFFGGLALDAAGAPHLAFATYGSSISAAVATNASGAWATRTLADASCCTCGVGLALSGDSVQVAYGAPGTSALMFGTDASGTFAAEQVDAQCDEVVSAVDSAGHAHVAWYGSGGTDVFYGTNRTGSWKVDHVQTLANGGYYLSLAVDADGHAHLTSSSLTGGLWYATNASGAWAGTPVDSRYASRGHALAIDAAGTVHACYQGTSGLFYGSSR